jgi:hypothetical protein
LLRNLRKRRKGMQKKWMWAGLIVAAVLVVLGCSKEEETGGGGGGTGTGEIYVMGGVGRYIYQNTTGDTTMEGAQIQVLTPDSLGTPVENATVKINGVQLPYLFGFYMGEIEYKRNYNYTLEVQAEEGNASATVNSPDLDSIRILSPQPGTHFDKNQDIEIKWQYFGNTPAGVFVVLAIDTYTVDSVFLTSGKTSYTVSGSKVVYDGDATASVFAGNYVYINGIAPGSLFGAGVGASVTFSVGDTTGGGGGGFYTVTVTPGENPVFEWTPAENVLNLGSL